MIRYMRAWLRLQLANPILERGFTDAEAVESFFLLPRPPVTFDLWTEFLTGPVKEAEKKAAEEQDAAIDGLLSDPALAGIVKKG